MQYDLQERTLSFSKAMIAFLKAEKIHSLNRNIIDQLIRSTTSVGANYAEANGASSRNDFRNKIFICKKEIQETKYWIKLLAEVISEDRKPQLRDLFKEAHELTLIFNKISGTLNHDS